MTYVFWHELCYIHGEVNIILGKYMSNEFRELLKKIGSGVHTSKNLSRQETAIAFKMMIEEEATPAQIGAFMIAHRIKRPTPEELAGILDAYDQLSNKLKKPTNGNLSS